MMDRGSKWNYGAAKLERVRVMSINQYVERFIVQIQLRVRPTCTVYVECAEDESHLNSPKITKHSPREREFVIKGSGSMKKVIMSKIMLVIMHMLVKVGQYATNKVCQLCY